MPDTAAPLGLLGGTFDPVHYGHLRLAEVALESLRLSRVRWIPAGRPPHRGTPGVSGASRLEMVRLAIAGHEAFELDDAEVRAEAPSYTVYTLERLRAELGPSRPLVLLMGGDAFLGLPSWHRWLDILGLAHLAVATRPGHPLHPEAMPPGLAAEFLRREAGPDALAAEPAGRVVPFAITPLSISATDIRAALAAGGSPRYLLPDPVLAYIRDRNLYC